MRRLSETIRQELIELRMEGRSIPEISKQTGVAKTTVQRYIKGIAVPKRLLSSLREKQGGSKDRAKALRINASERASALLDTVSERDCLMLLVGLYWGEGTKRDFGIINSDPRLIQVFLYCLRSVLHLPNTRLSMAIRLHEGISVKAAKSFWKRITNLPYDQDRKVEIVPGKKKGKLKYGMCRIRVRSGIRDRILLQSLISQIGKECSERVLSA